MTEQTEALHDVWHDLVKPLSTRVAQIERWGIGVDLEAIRHYQAEVTQQFQEASARLLSIAASHGMDSFNPNAPAQVGKLLFEKLKLRPIEFTDQKLPSTKKIVLEQLAKRNPVAQDIVDWREINTQLTRYVLPLPSFIRADGRVHPSIKIDGADTGRSSTEEPCIHFVSRAKTKLGKMSRDCYSAPPGSKMISFDYGQLELRVVANESGDVLMIQIFKRGEDLHYRTAQLISRQRWGIEPEDVPRDGEERSQAKAAVFGPLYGMSAPGLAAKIGCSVTEAERLLQLIMGKYKGVDRYFRKQLRFARQHGYVWSTWEGRPFRRRLLIDVASQDSGKRGHAERGTRNTPIQAKANDYCLFSLIDVVDLCLTDLRGWAKVTHSVHDSIILEVKDEAVDDVLAAVPELMTQWDSGDVPLVVDAEVGQSWGSLEKV